jgi:ABC-type uncharacterized transport system auxiliary subunit
MRYLSLALFAIASLTLSACNSPSSATNPNTSYNTKQTSTTTTTGNEENPPPPATRSAQHSGTPQ